MPHPDIQIYLNLVKFCMTIMIYDISYMYILLHAASYVYTLVVLYNKKLDGASMTSFISIVFVAKKTNDIMMEFINTK